MTRKIVQVAADEGTDARSEYRAIVFAVSSGWPDSTPRKVRTPPRPTDHEDLHGRHSPTPPRTQAEPLETFILQINEDKRRLRPPTKRRCRASTRIADKHELASDRMVCTTCACFFVNIARGYVGGSVLQDLIEEGNLGLFRRCRRVRSGCRQYLVTSTYASYRTSSSRSTSVALVNTAKAIRIPAYMVELLRHARRRMAADLQDAPRPARDRRGDRAALRTTQEEAGHRQEGDQGLMTSSPRPTNPENGMQSPARCSWTMDRRLLTRRDGRGRTASSGDASPWTRRG